MTDLSRRGALGLFAASLAAPAIIRTPGLLMQVLPPLEAVNVDRLWEVERDTRWAELLSSRLTLNWPDHMKPGGWVVGRLMQTRDVIMVRRWMTTKAIMVQGKRLELALPGSDDGFCRFGACTPRLLVPFEEIIQVRALAA